MAYNLYQAQMARAWAERINKETAVAEKFWTEQAMKTSQQFRSTRGSSDDASMAGSLASSACPSGYTSKTSYLKEKLEMLESELRQEKERRRRVETDLQSFKTGQLQPRPETPSSS